MIARCPRAWGEFPGSAVIRSHVDDFQVSEQLGFELSGEGEHCFLHLQKRQLNTLELQQRLSDISGVPLRDIGFSGLKDRNALTRQWFSVGLAGRAEPDWQALEVDAHIQVLAVARHTRKLRRGVHRANRFTLVLRELTGDHSELEERLILLRDQGVPNYFGEQRFGRNGATLEQATRWIGGKRKITRNKRSLYLSALRSDLFNRCLAARVVSGSWNRVQAGDVCMLQGSRSFFTCEEMDDDISSRAERGDIHPGLPLWGRAQAGVDLGGYCQSALSECRETQVFLEDSGLELSWRSARMMPDDFYWQFCDDGALQLDFALGAGNYATALLAELVQYKEGKKESGIASERG